MKTDPIQHYILKNEYNLNIASTVADAWIEARGKLVAGFLDRLDSRLKKKLKGWRSELYGGSFFVDAYPGFYVSKPTWKHHSIGFQCGEHGDRMTIGIARDTADSRKLPRYAPLLTAVQSILPAARSQAWWEARAAMRSPAPDWRKPDVLWRMHTDNEFVKDVAEQLLEIARVGEPILDRLYRRK
ncbi:MAG TPA: hypothetical protein PLE77_04810 [Kiritimatiellia bacterium]|nr:hypothetical protein [Kiritimatiellia bacterium]